MTKTKFIVRDGMVLIPGSETWHWWRANRQHLEGINPQAINPAHPKAPASHPLKAKVILPHKGAPLEEQIVAYAHLSLRFAGKMVYSEGVDREMLFGRPAGKYLNAHADCSQLGASILHWLGNKKVVNTDYTGTLLGKAKILKVPAAGRGAIWGPHTGAHFAWITEKVGNDWMTVGFGHQGAPDRNLLSGMNEYFDSVGEPGVRFLDFSA